MTDNTWDSLDHFLYFDYWHREGHEKSLKIRKNNFIHMINEFKSADLKVYLDKKSLYSFLTFKKVQDDLRADYLLTFKENYIEVLSLILDNKHQLVNISNNELQVLINNRVLVIRLVKESFLYKSTKAVNIFDINIDYFKIHRYAYTMLNWLWVFYRKFLSKLKVLRLKIDKKINNLQFNKNINDTEIILDNAIKLNEKSFLNLRIENKRSPSWIVRGEHLNIVTNHQKNIKVKKIIKYFKKKNMLEKLFSEVTESKIERKVEGSVSHSRYFWNSGNNYFLFSMYYQFKKNVVPYKFVNEYIEQDNSILVYTKKYYESLDSMNDEEIRDFLDSNLIEITNNTITSGKHRVFAMIGRLVVNKKYIPFTAKIY